MAEKVISPGVFTSEVDASFLPAAIGEIGAVVVGPTQKGVAGVPKVVSSYSEYVTSFGDSFKSGSATLRYLTSHVAEQYLKHQGRLTVVRIAPGATSAYANVPSMSLSNTLPSDLDTGGSSQGGPYFYSQITHTASKSPSFRINTISQGYGLNNAPNMRCGFAGVTTDVSNEVYTASLSQSAYTAAFTSSNQVLVSGSKDNFRWEISQRNTKKGTFTLLIRRGDDSIKRKQVLETWNNLTLDPKATNYIGRVIGTQYPSIVTDGNDKYVKMNGEYPNKSKYVYISNIKNTPDYLDENGDIRDYHQSASMPAVGSGSTLGAFAHGDDGNVVHFGPGSGSSFNENIGTTTQGFNPTVAAQGLDAYVDALSLLANDDEYDFNLLMLPGILANTHATVAKKAIDICESRGDAFVVLDPVGYGSAPTQATSQAETRDSNYTAMYWPWVRMPDTSLNRDVWVPPSVAVSGVYAFNDKVGHPWFAPAGLNRGTINTAIMAERNLTIGMRDTLYESNVNPIATFPGQGVCVWGQKTLQKKSSALDRVNVRRLLIKVKKFIASASRFLLFEQNTPALRKRFLNIANPYLEQVQAQSGLTAFRVIMDESNNTPDTVDRNQLIGQLFLQPTRTAEFILLDFTIQPTGATFPE